MCFKYDFHTGIKEKWKRFIVIIIIAMVHCIDIYTSVNTGKMSIGNIVFGLFGGISGISDQIEKLNAINLPVNWIMFNIGIFFIIGGYPIESLKGYGKNMLVGMKSRTKWIVGKYLWGVLSVVLSYIVLYLVIVVFSYCLDIEMNFKLTKSYKEIMDCSLNTDLREIDTVLYGILIPILSSVTMAIMQISLMLFVGQAYSFLVMIVYTMLSLFINSPLLIGNSGMMLRNNTVFFNSGNLSIFCILCNIVFIILFIIIGIKKMQKKDIF